MKLLNKFKYTKKVFQKEIKEKVKNKHHFKINTFFASLKNQNLKIIAIA